MAIATSCAGAQGEAPGPGLLRSAPTGGNVVMSQAELAEALDCGTVDLTELQAAAVEVAARLVVDPREQLEKQRLFRRGEEGDVLAVGRWVTLQGLQAQQLNGRQGLVVEAASAAGRLGVVLPGLGGKLVRPCHLAPLGDEDTVKVARLFCQGERHAGVQTWRWPPGVLCDRPHEASPFATRLGVPLRVTRVEPERPLRADADFDNRWLAHLMIDPRSGRVRRPWQSKPGPALVWRADGEAFSADDLCLVVCFIDALLVRYADKESPIDVHSEVTPEAFQSFKARELAAEENDPDRSRWWEDINL